MTISHFAADFQTEKALVRRFHQELSDAPVGEAAAVLARHTVPEWLWRGMHPFHEQPGARPSRMSFGRR